VEVREEPAAQLEVHQDRHREQPHRPPASDPSAARRQATQEHRVPRA
jgi:hypothetical protein